jgi:hypothetical protein
MVQKAYLHIEKYDFEGSLTIVNEFAKIVADAEPRDIVKRER